MREILFKSKRRDNGKWIYGCGVYDDNVISFIIDFDVDLIKEETSFKYIQVIPQTVCQYTGLKDKNSVKIFENDIVSGITGKPDGNDLIINNMKVTFDYMDLVMLEHTDNLEVIGNIFDEEVNLKENKDE